MFLRTVIIAINWHFLRKYHFMENLGGRLEAWGSGSRCVPASQQPFAGDIPWSGADEFSTCRGGQEVGTPLAPCDPKAAPAVAWGVPGSSGAAPPCGNKALQAGWHMQMGTANPTEQRAQTQPNPRLPGPSRWACGISSCFKGCNLHQSLPRFKWGRSQDQLWAALPCF